MNSTELFEKARKLVPGGVNSPVRSFKHVGGAPLYFTQGRASRITDTSGKSYVDFCLSFGPHLFGHSDPDIVAAVLSQIEKGTSYGACHPQEIEMAEWILKGYPFLDQVRLVNSGTEAVMTAVRLARGATGRDKIVVFEGCYHGHSDGLLAKAGSGVADLAESSSKGVPESLVHDTIVLRFDDDNAFREVLQAQGSQIAAVLMEPVPANYGLWIPTRERLKMRMDLAREAGALVIFDEVISGFRLGLSGASGIYDLQPDLVTLGKIVGGGLPLAALTGKKKLMEELAPIGPVYQAGTLSGNALAVAAGCAALKKAFETNPYAALEARTAWFANELKSRLAKRWPVEVTQKGSMFWLYFDPPSQGFPPKMSAAACSRYTEFFHVALEAGCYFPPSPYEVAFLSTAHTEDDLMSILEKLE